MRRGISFYWLYSILVVLIGCRTQQTPTIPPPAAPVLVSVVAVSAHRINVTWTYNGASITGFIIERNNGLDSNLSQVAYVGSTARSYADTMLQAATLYLYRIRAYRANAQSDPTVMMSATTLPTAPPAPDGLTASLSGSRAVLHWNYANTTIDSFHLEKKINQNAYVLLATLSDTARSYADTGLVDLTYYTYRIRAYNITGGSPYSNEAGVNTLGVPPVGPSNLHLFSNTPGVIQIAWYNNAVDVDGIKIQRRVTGQDSFTVVGQRYPFDTLYIDQGITRLTTYEYRVFAFNTYGTSATSNTISVTSTETLPPVPLLVGATTLTTNSIKLSWICNTSNVDSFQIQRKTGLNGNYQTNFAFAHISDTTFVDSTCMILQTYGYRMCSINRIGLSAFSNECTATTPDYTPSQPTNLTARPLASNRVTLYWTDNSTNETSFVIERKTGIDGTFAQVGTALAQIHSWDDFSCSSSTIYGYHVYAHGTGGNSAPTNTAYAMTFVNTQELGSFNVEATPNSILLEGGMAFVGTDTLGVKVLNVSVPSFVRVVGSIQLAGATYDIAMVNDTAYCANGTHGLQIASMGNAAEPTYVTSYALPGEAKAITIVNNLAYISCGSGGMQIVRLYNIAQITTVGWFTLSDIYATAEQTVLSGHLAFIAFGWGGAKIVDISNPSTATLVGSMTVDNAQAMGVAVKDTLACVAYGYAGLHIFNISDPTNPVDIATIPTDDFATKVVVSGNYAIFADRGSGVKIVNLATPGQPLYAGTFPTPTRATNLCVVGNIAYVTDLETGIHIVSMSLP